MTYLKHARNIFFGCSGMAFFYGVHSLMTKPLQNREIPDSVKAYGKTFIITGANSGLGKETAKDLASRGGKVIMACRDMDKCEKARQEIIEKTFNKKVLCKECDLESFESIKNFAVQIYKEEPRVDVLINNAGVLWGKKLGITKEGFEKHFGINYLGHFLLTQLLVDKLIATGSNRSSPSRIIFLGSCTYFRGQMEWHDLNRFKNYSGQQAYEQSKLSILHFSKKLSEELKGQRVNVYNVHPGLTDTNLYRNNPLNNSILKYFFEPFNWFLFKSVNSGIQTIIFCALEESLDTFTGDYFRDCLIMPITESHANNKKHRERLWDISVEWTNLRDTLKEQNSLLGSHKRNDQHA